ncbi:MAG: ATP-binding cassette domain-containing protein [Pseudomonadota bacterium]
MSATPVISLQQASLTYRKRGFSGGTLTAVKSVDLEIAAGETLGLVGESGSGKSSLGKLCLGLAKPSEGNVAFQGAPFPGRKALLGKLSVVLQHPEWALNPRLRCGPSVAEPLEIAKWGDAVKRSARVAELMGQVGLDPSFAERYPGELSGGQRQRVAIARALATQPEFVLFDEAVSALDVSVQAQILNLIRSLQAEQGFAALFISHDLAATRYLCNRIAVMYKGEIVEQADARRFYGQPDHPYSRALLAAIS